MDELAENTVEAAGQIVEVKDRFRGYRIAGIVSHLFNPSITGVIFMVSMLLLDGNDLMESLKWLLILLGINLIPLGILTAYLLWQKKIDTIFVRTRQKRTSMYMTSSILMGISCAIMAIFGAPMALIAATAIILFINTIFMCVNFFWKISVHAAFTTIAICALFLLLGTIAVGLILLLPLVSWARIKLGFHTPAQVIGGTAVAAAIFISTVSLSGVI